MFERFTDKARQVVIGAQAEARERGADEIRTEHLLAGLFRVPDGLAVTVLTTFEIDRDAVLAEIDRLRRPAPRIDADALSTLGIDLEEVRRQTEEAFGPGALDRTRAAHGPGPRFGHIPFARSAKKSLELSLREAVHLKHKYLGTEHLLLGLLHCEDGAAHHILTGLGMRLAPARTVVADLVRERRAG